MFEQTQCCSVRRRSPIGRYTNHRGANFRATVTASLGSRTSGLAGRRFYEGGALGSEVLKRGGSITRHNRKQHPPCLRRVASRPVDRADSTARQVSVRALFRRWRRDHDSDIQHLLRIRGECRLRRELHRHAAQVWRPKIECPCSWGGRSARSRTLVSGGIRRAARHRTDRKQQQGRKISVHEDSPCSWTDRTRPSLRIASTTFRQR
jgi:hypothetical protein